MKSLSIFLLLAGFVFSASAQQDNGQVIDLANCPSKRVGVYETEKVLIYFEVQRYENQLLGEIDRFLDELKKNKDSKVYQEKKRLYETRILGIKDQLLTTDTIHLTSYVPPEIRQTFFWNDVYFVMQMLDESQACIYNKKKGKFEDQVILRNDVGKMMQRYVLPDNTVVVSRNLRY